LSITFVHELANGTIFGILLMEPFPLEGQWNHIPTSENGTILSIGGRYYFITEKGRRFLSFVRENEGNGVEEE